MPKTDLTLLVARRKQYKNEQEGKAEYALSCQFSVTSSSMSFPLFHSPGQIM